MSQKSGFTMVAGARNLMNTEWGRAVFTAVVVAGAMVTIVGVAARVAGVEVVGPNRSSPALFRWDSGWYAHISQKGYIYADCPEDPSQACGNAGWFPLYPIILRLLFVRSELGMAFVSSMFTVFALIILSIRQTLCKQNLLVAALLLIGSLPPSMIFLINAFPLGLSLFLAACVFWLLGHMECTRKQRSSVPLLSALVGLSALAYANGFLVGIAASVALLTTSRGGPTSNVRTRQSKVLLMLAPALSAIACTTLFILSVSYTLTNRLDLFFRFQAKYNRQPLDPVRGFIQLVKQGVSPFDAQNPVSWSLVIVAVGLATLVVSMIVMRKRQGYLKLEGGLQCDEVFSLVLLALAIFFSISQKSTEAIYRHVSYAWVPAMFVSLRAIAGDMRMWARVVTVWASMCAVVGGYAFTVSYLKGNFV